MHLPCGLWKNSWQCIVIHCIEPQHGRYAVPQALNGDKPKKMTSKLSPEILQEIFSLLSEADIYTCLSVCRSWFYPAAYLYYHTINIKDSNNRLANFRDYILKSHLPVRYLIKHIKIDGNPASSQTDETKQTFQDVLSLCPNLKELTMTRNTIYWKYINECSFEFKPNRLLSTGRKSCSDDTYYYKASHKFRNHITELEIHRSCDDSIYQNFHSLFDYLADFKRLKHLSISSGSQKHIVYFDQLLKSCKNLKSLSYQIDHPLVKFEIDEAIYPSMHALDIFTANFTVASLQYIIRRFVSLKKLTLRINQNEREPNISQFFKMQFVPFLQSLEYTNLQFQINGRSTLEDMVHYMNKIHNKANAHFHLHEGRAERTQISLLREKERLDMRIVFVRDIATNQLDALPYTTYLQKFGSTIEQLSITHTTHLKYREASDINAVFNACPQLKQLSIHLEQSPTVYFSENSSAQSRYPSAQISAIRHTSELERLSLSCMTVDYAFFQALSCYHPRLKELSFTNCISEHKETESKRDCFDLTGLQLNTLAFDIMAYRRMNRDWDICVTIDINNTTCQRYLSLQSPSPKNNFTSISENEYNDMDQDKMHTILLKLNTLERLELHAGKNHAFSRSIQF